METTFKSTNCNTLEKVLVQMFDNQEISFIDIKMDMSFEQCLDIPIESSLDKNSDGTYQLKVCDSERISEDVLSELLVFILLNKNDIKYIHLWEAHYQNSSIIIFIYDSCISIVTNSKYEYTIFQDKIEYEGAFRGFLSQTFCPHFEVEEDILKLKVKSSIMYNMSMIDYIRYYRTKLYTLYKEINYNTSYPLPYCIWKAIKGSELALQFE